MNYSKKNLEKLKKAGYISQDTEKEYINRISENLANENDAKDELITDLKANRKNKGLSNLFTINQIEIAFR